MAFPTIATVLDNFNRANANISGSTSSGDGTWSTTQVQNASANALKIVSNQLQAAAGGNNGLLSTSYGPDTEVYCTAVAIPSTYIALWSRLNGTGASTYNGYLLVASVVAGTNNDTWAVRRVNAGVQTTLTTFTGPDLAAGDQIGFEVLGTGATVTINVYRKASGGSWTLVGTFADSSASRITTAGQVAIELGATTVQVDDLSGGTSTSVTTFSKTGGGKSPGIAGAVRTTTINRVGGAISKPHIIVTNLIPNGGGELNSTGWVNNAGGETISRDLTTSFDGVASIKVICPGSVVAEGALIHAVSGSLVGGGVITLQVRVKTTVGIALRLELAFRSAANAAIGSGNVTSFTSDGTWQFVTVTGALIDPNIDHFSLKVRINGTAAATINIDAAQGEVGSSANQYVDTQGSSASRTFTIGGPGGIRSTIAGKQGGGFSGSFAGATKFSIASKIGGGISFSTTGATTNVTYSKTAGSTSSLISGATKSAYFQKQAGSVSDSIVGALKVVIVPKVSGATVNTFVGGDSQLLLFVTKSGGAYSTITSGGYFSLTAIFIKTGGSLSRVWGLGKRQGGIPLLSTGRFHTLIGTKNGRGVLDDTLNKMPAYATSSADSMTKKRGR